MELTKELLEKAKAAKSAEELLTLAHENGMKEFTEENAKTYFERLHKSGELADEELNNVAGGCGDDEKYKCTRCGSKWQLIPRFELYGTYAKCPSCGYETIIY